MMKTEERRTTRALEPMILDLQGRLAERAKAATRGWWERYLKGAIRFRGVKMGDIREEVLEWNSERLGAAPVDLQWELAIALLKEPFAEDKLAGILYLEEVLIPSGSFQWPMALRDIAALFDRGFISDWNTCDWLCVKSLAPLIRRAGEPCAREISGWRQAENLWRMRASGVAFVTLAKRGEGNFQGFTAMLLEVCAATVSRPDRFAQTGTGWVLRELSVAEGARVADFIEENIGKFSKEGLRYAIAKLPEARKKALLRLRAGGGGKRPAARRR
jgi:3-methyladenine DNA glycosylase AlkD